MTDTDHDHDHDGWPEEYRDPRDRPHPDTLRVTVETGTEAHEAVVATAEAIADGEARPAVVSFATVGDLRDILTDRRIELLRALVATDGAAASISALADDLGRDYRAVHDDVSLLADYGLLYLIEEAGAKRPYVPYERIILDVELAGDDDRADPAPA